MRKNVAIAGCLIASAFVVGIGLIGYGWMEWKRNSNNMEIGEPDNSTHVDYDLGGYSDSGTSNLLKHYLDSAAGDHVIARMYIPDTSMETPIVDSDYYFRRNIEGKYDTAGVPLVLTTDHFLKPGHNAIIYGHRLDTGEDFGMLREYLDQTFYDQHPDIMLETTAGTTSWHIVSVFALNYQTDAFDYTQCEDLTDAGNRNYFLSQIKSHNMITVGDYTSSEDDEYITLSTCHYETHPDNGRLVVVAIRK